MYARRGEPSWAADRGHIASVAHVAHLAGQSAGEAGGCAAASGPLRLCAAGAACGASDLGAVEGVTESFATASEPHEAEPSKPLRCNEERHFRSKWDFMFIYIEYYMCYSYVVLDSFDDL